jgi:hypothetical protein
VIPSRFRFALVVALGAACLGQPQTLIAQSSRITMVDFTTGNDFEEYLRAIQIDGIAPLYPWSIRSFSRREIDRLVSADTTSPWKLKDRFSRQNLSAGSVAMGVTFNSAYPYGANDGPLWAGRGLTVAASGGVSGYVGPVSFAFAPMAFSAANRPFDLLPNGYSGPPSFNHGTNAGAIDYPQRFGNKTYSRLDPGSTYLRFDSRLLSAGVSTANEWIGPATEFPFLLGNNAPGFPHLFIGSGAPLNVGLGRVHGRIMWGRLNQSDYSPVTGGEHYINSNETGTVRLMASIEGVFIPRGLPGLEVGVARFIHVPYRVGEPRSDFWRKPFKVFFLKNEFAKGDSVGGDNQLASIFFRWAFPNAGLEVYGERGYEDQFYDFREFITNLDHDREYMIGFQKVLRKRADAFDVLRAEVVNYQTSTLLYTRAGEGAVYLHGTLRQGHTNRGQLLGAYPGVGAAAGSVLSWTLYSPQKRTAFTLRRILRDQIGALQTTGVASPKGSDVIVAIGAEQMHYGRYVDLGGRVEAMDDLNRNFTSDVGNLNLQLTFRLHPR